MDQSTPLTPPKTLLVLHLTQYHSAQWGIVSTASTMYVCHNIRQVFVFTGSQDAAHPFVTSMAAYLLEAQRRITLPALIKDMTTPAQWEMDRKSMNMIVDKGDYPAVWGKYCLTSHFCNQRS